MSLLEELLDAVYSEIDGSYPSSAPTLQDYGPGSAPDNKTNPVLGWTVLGDTEWYALQLGSDYYADVLIQFDAWSSKKSPQQAVQIIEAVKTLFRNNANDLSLATGRVVDIDIGTTQTFESSVKEGWRATTTMTFELGT